MKKGLSIIVAVMLIVSSFVTVSATGTCSITSEPVNAKAGESFSADVILSDNPGLAALSLAVEYDDSLFRLASVENGEVFSESAFSTSNNNENSYKVNWANVDLSNTVSNGKLVSLKFDVPSGCETTSTAVKLHILQAFDSDLEDVTVNTTDIKIDIKGVDKKITGVSITHPTKTDYMINEDIDLTGLTVKALYSDKSSIDVTDKAEIKGFDSSKAGTKLVVVSYKDFSTAFAVKIKSSDKILYLKSGVVKAVAGDTVEVPIEVLNNPGICGIESKISFDSNLFTMQSVANGNIFESSSMTAGGNKAKTPYTVFWENATATENYMKNGKLGTVTLKVKSNVKTGRYPVSFGLCNAVDCDLNSVGTVDEESMIHIYSRKYLFADVTGDGRTNVKDATAIQKHVSGFDITIDESAGDCEEDGVISVLDATKIQKMSVRIITDERFGTYIYV